MLSIDQDDFTPNLRNIAPSILSKSGSRYENAFVGFLSLQYAKMERALTSTEVFC